MPLYVIFATVAPVVAVDPVITVIFPAMLDPVKENVAPVPAPKPPWLVIPGEAEVM